MKKFGAFALAAALTGSLLTPALAAAGSSLRLNGTDLDTSALPSVSGVPMRLLAESDHGSAEWLQEENSGLFSMDSCTFIVNFADGSVERNGEPMEGIKAQVVNGVTFLPAEAFDGLEGYTAETADGVTSVTTPSSDPLLSLVYTIADAGNVAYGMKADPDFLQSSGIDPACFTEFAAFFPMIVTPDTVLVGKLAEGKEQDARTALEAYRKQQEDTFSWYLSHNLPKVQDARMVVKDGYFLFVIAENADAAVAAFEHGLAALNG